MENINDDELPNFLDGSSTNAEKDFLKNELTTNSILKKRIEELEHVHSFFQKQNQLEHPSKNFTNKVMANLHTQITYSFASPRNGLLLLIGLLVASTLAILLIIDSPNQLHAVFDINQLTVKNDWVKLPSSIPFDLKMAVKIFVMANIVIAFVLLDRTILRPIFRERAERFS